MPVRKQITVKLTEKDADSLYKIAKQNHLSVAEQSRQFIKKGISVDAYQNDEEKILEHMKTALREVLDPQVERMVKISVKNAISSSVNLLYTSMMLYRICARDVRPKLEEFMEQARLMGIRFVQLSKGSIDDFLKSSMEQLNELWEGK